MAYFSSASFPANTAGTPASNFPGGGTPEETPLPTTNHGTLVVGTASLQRNVVQFMNGAGIVDYGSITITTNSVSPAEIPGGKIHMIDTRAGTTATTTGYSPNVTGTETWTATFKSAAGVNGLAVTNFTSGATPTITTATHGLTTGETVRVTGTGDAGIDDQEFAITVVTPTTFTLTGATTTSTGTQGLVGEVGNTAKTAEIFDLSVSGGASPGAAGSFSVNTNSIILDRMMMYVEQGTVGNEWLIGDKFSFKVLVNPNTATKWLDPNPEFGEYQAAAVAAGSADDASVKNTTNVNVSSSSDEMGNTRVLISDPVGLGNNADKVYMEVGYWREEGTDEYCLTFRGMTGYVTPPDSTTAGNHPSPTPFGYVNLDNERVVFKLICDQYSFRGIFETGSSELHCCYIGFLDTFTTRQEHAYPLISMMQSETPAAAGVDTYKNSIVEHGSNIGGYPTWSYDTASVVQQIKALSSSGSTENNFPSYIVPFWAVSGGQGTSGARNYYDGQYASICVSPNSVISETALFPSYLTSQIPGGSTADSHIGTASEPRGYVWGELRGVFAVSANATSAGDTVTVGSDEYYCVGWKRAQSASASGSNINAAFKLE